VYEVGHTLGAYLFAEGWARPVDVADVAVPVAMTDFEQSFDDLDPPNLRRELFPPYYDGPPAIAMDGRRRKRK
jgi:hypothetical protein